MSNVKWVRLTVDMFDDEKIRLIEQMPEADTILIIWIKLLAQAGKTNASGYIYLSENIPYTDEMLATIFNRPISTVRLALNTFQQFGMIAIDEKSFISISNWEKHQNEEGLARIREQTRKRVAKHREKKQLESPKQDVTLHETLRNATDIDKELDIDKDKEYIPYAEIIKYLNEKSEKNYKHTASKTKQLIKARWNEGHKLDDFKKVIDICCANWKGKEFGNGQKGDMYLRPSTLFNGKFNERLNWSMQKSNKPVYEEDGDEGSNGKHPKKFGDVQLFE